MELFYFAYRAFTARADRILERRGLGRVHHRILYFVGQRPETSVHGLLDILGVTKQALHAPLRQLVAMKLVTSELAVHDRRVKRLHLTALGAKLEAALTRTQMEDLARVFKKVGADAEVGWRAAMGALSQRY